MITLTLQTIAAVAAVYVVAFTPSTFAEDQNISALEIVVSEKDEYGGERYRANTRVEIQHESQRTVNCDDVSNDNGLIRCEISCDPDYKLTKTFRVIFPRDEFYATPGPRGVELRNCNINPQRIEAMYRHWRLEVLVKERQFELFVQNSEHLKRAQENISDSKVVTKVLSLLASDKSGDEQLSAFGKKSADLSEIYKKLGDQQEAARFMRYEVSAAQALLSAQATKLGSQQPFNITGELEDYYHNVATVRKLLHDSSDSRVRSHRTWAQDFDNLEMTPLNRSEIKTIHRIYREMKETM